VWNVDFLSVFPNVNVNDLNKLEKYFLGLLTYNVSLKASEYRPASRSRLLAPFTLRSFLFRWQATHPSSWCACVGTASTILSCASWPKRTRRASLSCRSPRRMPSAWRYTRCLLQEVWAVTRDW